MSHTFILFFFKIDDFGARLTFPCISNMFLSVYMAMYDYEEQRYKENAKKSAYFLTKLSKFSTS